MTFTPSSPSSDRPLKDRIALVTGASRGIGRATALALHTAGAHVIACAKTSGALEELDDAAFAATGQHMTLLPFDLIDVGALERLPEALAQRFPRLDILVHAGGILGGLWPVGHIDPKDFGKVITVNLTASYRLIRALEPLLRLSPTARAIFLSSGVVQNPRAYWGPYAASKAGLEAMVKCWGDEMEHTGLKVAVVNPGAMATQMRAEAFPGEDPATLPSPELIGPLMVELARPESHPGQATINFREFAAENPQLIASHPVWSPTA